MKAANVIFTPVSISITHTRAVVDAVGAGARAIALTAVTEGMMVSGGLDADFQQVKARCVAMGERMAKTKEVHVASREGTDLTFRVEAGGQCDALCGESQFSPFHCGVNFPHRGTATASRCQHPYLGIGLLKKPIRFIVKDALSPASKG